MNDELMLVYEFLLEKHEIFLKSNRIKSNEERLRWSHAVETVRNVAENYNIVPKNNKK